MPITARMASENQAPWHHRTQTAATSAAPITGHASYRVMHASAKATPTVAVEMFLLPSHHAISSATAVIVSAISSGSVIGVDCRYSTFGFSANTAAPATAAALESVSAATIQSRAPVAAARLSIEIGIAENPVR